MKKVSYCLLTSLLPFISIHAGEEKVTPPATASATVNYFPQEEHIATYLSQMPWQFYKQYEVKNLGKFWVDEAYDCVKDTVKQGIIWEPYIIDVLTCYLKEGDSVVDIGTHIGTISLAMSNLVGEKGKVYSFEGERQFFREFVENVKLNNKKNIFPHLCWVSDVDETRAISHFYPLEYSKVSTAAQSTTYPLHVRRLDSFNYKNIALMKIDVECTEDQVLEGARNTIKESRPIIVIEIQGGFGVNPSEETTKKINKTIKTLEGMDYEVKLLHIDDYLAIPKEKITKK